ncbi:hypothetical protein BpHYR1_021197 [Brachionus plicatilis]|uniref:Uncharacterized protein n=1 Tax=Brachionus plicatilis TaxID=10195 RepID=A0A3M7TAI1_BRAPC|nr:hypothetical protein BpHYR1_021197 [Brachionus plicatilis]
MPLSKPVESIESTDCNCMDIDGTVNFSNISSVIRSRCDLEQHGLSLKKMDQIFSMSFQFVIKPRLMGQFSLRMSLLSCPIFPILLSWLLFRAILVDSSKLGSLSPDRPALIESEPQSKTNAFILIKYFTMTIFRASFLI